MIRSLLILISLCCFFFPAWGEDDDIPAAQKKELQRLYDDCQRFKKDLNKDSLQISSDQLLKLGKTYNSNKWIGTGLWLKADYQLLIDQKDSALSSLLMAQQRLQTASDLSGLAKVYNSLGLLYRELNNLNLSRQYKFEALSVFEELKDYDNQLVVLNNLAGDYLALDKLDSSILLFNKALELEPHVTTRRDVLIFALTGRSSTHFFNGNTELALNDVNLAKKYANKFGSPESIVAVLHCEADIFYLTGDRQKCIDSSNHFKNQFQNRFQLRDWYRHYERLAWSYKELNQSDSAIKYFMQFQLYKDSIENKESRDALNSKFAQFEVDALTFKTKLAEEVSRRERNQKFFLLAICLVVIAALILILLYFRKYRIQKELTLKTQREAAEKTIANTREILANQSQLILDKNRIIEQLNESVQSLFGEDIPSSAQLEGLLDSRILTREDWIKFKSYFKALYPDFFDNLENKYPNLTESEERLLCLLKLGMTNKEIGDMLGIMPKSVSRTLSRFREKFGIDPDMDVSKILDF